MSAHENEADVVGAGEDGPNASEKKGEDGSDEKGGEEGSEEVGDKKQGSESEENSVSPNGKNLAASENGFVTPQATSSAVCRSSEELLARMNQPVMEVPSGTEEVEEEQPVKTVLQALVTCRSCYSVQPSPRIVQQIGKLDGKENEGGKIVVGDPFRAHQNDQNGIINLSYYHGSWDMVVANILRCDDAECTNVVNQLNELFGSGVLSDAELLKCVAEYSEISIKTKKGQAKLVALVIEPHIVPRAIRFIALSTKEYQTLNYNTRKKIAKHLLKELPYDEVKGLHAWAMGDQHTNFSVDDASESIVFGMTTFAFANKLI